MARVAAAEAFETRLAGGWSHGAIIPENADSMTPSDGAAFLYVHFPVARSEQLTFGTPGQNVFREEGACRMVIHVAQNSGLDAARQWASELIDLFAGAAFDGVVCRAIDGPATDNSNENGVYYQLAVAVAYEFDFTA
ncbi:phage tail terminator-like protein [Notoacmeibacter sp. MSK16QG-6]|uniref:phage tail terminator-like protein n=1 Tax=Notoacmeibacter sp. MSK16QG-6 TaxID=2957982 RepID=UPI0020A0C4A8|nr:phage tail terminator-like protein [Notoacmeibacter sp. MSK16QG-6]MCP1200056.1 DUF4128 domain-containing protein [Notoacmeibacter sp. MSK16QG-6]